MSDPSSQSQLREAVDRLCHVLRLAPHDGQLHFKVALAAWKADQFELVEPHLLSAARLEPRNAEVQEALARWFSRQQQFTRALHHVEAALTLHPGSIPCRITRADILSADGQQQAAWEVIGPLISAGISGTRLVRVLARLAPAVGQERLAIDSLDHALQVPGLVARNDVPRLRFALAALLERIGQYDLAFAQAQLANEASRRDFDRDAYSRSVSLRIDYYTKERFQTLPRAAHGNRRPVLIVGMPRSGTSLVEQILATHPQVFGGGELTTLYDIALSISKAPWSQGTPFMECGKYLSLQHANEFAARYLSKIESLNSEATYVTDKMPLNYLLLGLVASLLPDIRIIHCMRDARDVRLSCYFTDFRTRNDFTFDLSDLVSVYRDYLRLMAHWKQVLPIPILDVRYEDLVSDQRGQTRRMLEFLGLPWNEQCMAFHRNQRIVTTASRQQVRQPIYWSSIGRWRNYETFIGELLGL